MAEFKEKLVHLLHYPNISWSTVFRLLKKDPCLTTFNPASQFLIQLNPPFQIPHLFEIIQEHINQYETNKISVITIFDDDYPPLLKEIYQPPWALFAKGDLSLLKSKTKLAVVGSRQPTQYGRNAMRKIFPELIENGITIVSGLAQGIDTFAHENAIKNGGKTIAVIAGGLYHIYPKVNRPLAAEMMETQLIVSEYPPDTKPLRWHFPARNRIISGITNGTFIIEAKRKSGSLITANYAVNEGRDVFSLPGSIFNEASLGTNDLIQQGAKLVIQARDILDEIRR